MMLIKSNFRVKTSLVILFYSACAFLLFTSCSKHEETDLFKLKWEKYRNNPIVKPGLYGWDSKQVYPGTILYNNKNYLMWYYGQDNNGPLQIGFKRSDDGIDWRKIQDKPVLTPGERGSWDDLRISKPCVIFVDGQYKMWYLGGSKQNKRIIPCVGLASSEDGISWEKDGSNPVFNLANYDFKWASFLRYFWVLKDSANYKMWFSAVGIESYNNIESIGYAFSDDGIDWEVHPQPVLERDTTSVWEDFYVSNPSVIKEDSAYYMFYGGLGRYGYLFKEGIGLAKSYDGVHWQKYFDNPILINTEEQTAWDREFVTNPRVLPVEKNRYYLWYLGADKKTTKEELGNYQIGLAIGRY